MMPRTISATVTVTPPNRRPTLRIVDADGAILGWYFALGSKTMTHVLRGSVTVMDPRPVTVEVRPKRARKFLSVSEWPPL